MTDFHHFMPGTLWGLLKKLIGEFRDASHGPHWRQAGDDKAIGKPHGRLNIKIHIVPKLLENLEDTIVVGDKGYNKRALRR